MFDFFRHHMKFFMWLLFILIIPSFVLFGIEGYTRFNENARVVATVDGHNITQQQWDQAHHQQVDRITSANPSVDVSLLDTPQMRRITLEQMLRERVMAVAAQKMRLVTTDKRLARQLREDPFIASLRSADGQLDMARYREVLARQGMTPEIFENSVRADLSARQVLAGVTQSGFALPAQVAPVMDAFLEQRQVQILSLPASGYAKQFQPTDAELQAFYDSHLSDYQAPEAVDIEFVVLDADAMKKQASISDDDLKAYYDNNQATLGSPEERRASHILVAADKSAPAAEREKAKAEAEKLLDEVRKNPAAFAEVAKRASQDDASAAHGGDLGFFRKDRGIEPAIAEAAFALARKGDISGVVESDYGYHIVHLTDLKPADVPAFDKVKDQLKEQLLAEQAQKLAAEHGEAFRNDVYEQPDSLQPVADKLKLNIQTATNVTRTVQPDAIVKPLANAKFLSALFAPDSLERKNNTEAIEFAPGQLVAGRVVKHTPAHPRPFDEVKTAVRERLIAERAAEAARKEGTEKLAAWKAKPEEAKGLPAAITLSREETHDLPAAVVEGVLRADASALPAFIGVDLGEQGYTLARIEKIVPRSETKTEVAQQMRQQYDIAWGAAEALAYYELLKQRFKARILVEEPKTAASEEAGR